METENQNPSTPNQISQPPVETPPLGTVTSQPEQKSKRRRPKALLLVAVMVLAGLGYLGWRVLHTDSKPVARTVVQDVPSLRYGTLGGPVGAESVFPNAQGDSESVNVSIQIFEGLVGYKKDKIVPLLASSWTNPDTSTWIFKIAKDVTFQDGTAMTASDVAQSLGADLKNETWGSYLSTVKTVAATGPDEVTITTTQPDSLLLNRLVYAFVFKQDDKTYYGTGPYTVDTSKTADSNHIDLRAYDKYHGGSPKTKQVSITTYEDSKMLLAAYNQKKIDMFVTQQSGDQAELGNAQHASFSYTDAGSFGLRMNTLRPNGALANPKVREAVAYAIDRQALAKESTDPLVPTRDTVPKSVIGYDSEATFPNFNLTKSKQLQTDAGYPNGAPLTFMYYKGAQPIPPLVIKQLQAAGFKVTENPVATTNDFVKQASQGNYDLLGMTYFSAYNDATDIFTGLLDSQNADFPSYSNPAADALLKAAEGDFNPASHIQKVKALNRYVTSNYLWVPINTTAPSVYYLPGLQIQDNYVVSQQTTSFWQVGQMVRESIKK